jgi:hypothetical protein
MGYSCVKFRVFTWSRPGTIAFCSGFPAEAVYLACSFAAGKGILGHRTIACRGREASALLLLSWILGRSAGQWLRCRAGGRRGGDARVLRRSAARAATGSAGAVRACLAAPARDARGAGGAAPCGGQAASGTGQSAPRVDRSRRALDLAGGRGPARGRQVPRGGGPWSAHDGAPAHASTRLS